MCPACLHLQCQWRWTIAPRSHRRKAEQLGKVQEFPMVNDCLGWHYCIYLPTLVCQCITPIHHTWLSPSPFWSLSLWLPLTGFTKRPHVMPLKAAGWFGRESNECNSKHTHRVGRFLRQSGKPRNPTNRPTDAIPNPGRDTTKNDHGDGVKNQRWTEDVGIPWTFRKKKIEVWWKSIYTIYHQIKGGGWFLEEESRTLGNWCDTKGGQNYFIDLNLQSTVYIYTYFLMFWSRVIDSKPSPNAAVFPWNASNKRDSWTVGHQC